MNISQLKPFKQTGEKISCLTAYDYSFAKLFDECGIDVILVGDSLGNVIHGNENTLSVSMNDMIYHTKIVAKACKNALLVADMPYKSYQNPQQTLINAKKLIDAGAKMVKFEGGSDFKECFNILHDNNIPVCGHLGLMPQSVVEMGGYKVQGRDKKSATKILEDAILLEELGVKVLVLECIPSELGKQISQNLTIPTIGIGAGVDCDGQVLVSYDMLGVNTDKTPKFVKNFLSCGSIKIAVKGFIDEVKNKEFPSSKHSY